MKAHEFYIPIYEMLENVTPIKKDCGILCGSICCKETNKEGERTGMLLFPFEERLLSNALFDIEDSNYIYGNKKTKILFCDGNCNRKYRPLACRIFPLVPYKKEGKPLKLIMNPLAKNMCPLARSLEVEQLEPLFVKNVYKAISRILKLKDGESYIKMLTEISDTYLKF